MDAASILALGLDKDSEEAPQEVPDSPPEVSDQDDIGHAAEDSPQEVPDSPAEVSDQDDIGHAAIESPGGGGGGGGAHGLRPRGRPRRAGRRGLLMSKMSRVGAKQLRAQSLTFNNTGQATR